MLAQPHHRRHQPSATARHHSPNPYSLDYDLWAEMLMKSNRNSFGRPDTEQNFGPWTRRPLPPPPSASAASDELKYPPPTNTRAQTIEKYRQEMMDLVRNMPEEEEEEVPAYELSLRDIVESPVAKKPEVETAEDSFEMKRKQRRVSREGKNGMSGLLMKAFIPRVRAALGGRKRIAGVGAGKGAKVSPKPSNSDCEERSCSNGSCDSSSSRRNGGGMGSCYSFLHKHRSKSMEI
ncbi:uncharacterized protein LOC110097949 [Dendrobium catenatum]|uniref:Uncharacterized protein n=1 Tax=Dendrobium catenatum TaxID=906689 RepID=A0A2I0WC16_9ASPA|nr:uncharacterized protein LOC110097949 [Dendrobium catenatum]PKU73194.1 hypothetical protein MA16_Dca019775 [Dendrobium catenatum]